MACPMKFRAWDAINHPWLGMVFVGTSFVGDDWEMVDYCFNHIKDNMLDIMSPIVGWCLFGTFTTPCERNWRLESEVQEMCQIYRCLLGLQAVVFLMFGFRLCVVFFLFCSVLITGDPGLALFEEMGWVASQNESWEGGSIIRWLCLAVSTYIGQKDV